MCSTTGPISRWCEQHRARYYTYEHIGQRPVIQRIEFGYGIDGKLVMLMSGASPTRKQSIDSGPHAITVYVELRWSGGKARQRPPWTSVFCLRDRPDLSGDGVRQVVCNMVKQEIKRLGWGYSRGVKCQP